LEDRSGLLTTERTLSVTLHDVTSAALANADVPARNKNPVLLLCPANAALVLRNFLLLVPLVLLLDNISSCCSVKPEV
jgi:hypothetical protein